LDEEAGSFSPELMHGNDDEDAIDPDEDKAELVHSLFLQHCAFFIEIETTDSNSNDYLCSQYQLVLNYPIQPYRNQAHCIVQLKKS
jgi:hypothetical protein